MKTSSWSAWISFFEGFSQPVRFNSVRLSQDSESTLTRTNSARTGGLLRQSSSAWSVGAKPGASQLSECSHTWALAGDPVLLVSVLGDREGLSSRQQVRHLGEEEPSTRWERVFQGFLTMFAFYKIIPAAVKKKKEIWAATWVKL